MLSKEVAECLHARFDKSGDRLCAPCWANIAEEDRLHPYTLICALMKAYELHEKPDRFYVCAERDLLRIIDIDDMKETTTKDDIKYLLDCGAFQQENSICLFA